MLEILQLLVHHQCLLTAVAAAGVLGAGAVPSVPLCSWLVSCVLGTQRLGTVQLYGQSRSSSSSQNRPQTTFCNS